MNTVVRHGRLFLMVLMVGAMFAGCDQSVKKQNAALWDENKELRDQLASTREALDASDADRARGVVAQDRTPAPVAPVAPVADFQNEPGVQIDRAPNRVTVRLEGDVLFASGSASVQTGAKAALNRVSAVIKSRYAGNEIRIEGHTDSDPISRTKDKWRDNQHLSEARAQAVKSYLGSQGVSNNNMLTIGYGETQPRVPNTSRANKAQNRRVEIVVITSR